MSSPKSVIPDWFDRESREFYDRFPLKKRGNVSISESGFSFLELVMVIALIGIVAGVMAKMFVWGVDMFDAVSTRKDSMQGGRIGVEFLTSDLRSISDAANITTATTTNLVFDNIDSETINYSFSAGILTRNTNSLLEGLSNFQFTYTDVDGNTLSSPVASPENIWKISFSVDATVDGDPFHLESSVVPRSFD